nr:MAG TPA: hypothetical protein [Caudoviricetes sp.]
MKGVVHMELLGDTVKILGGSHIFHGAFAAVVVHQLFYALPAVGPLGSLMLFCHFRKDLFAGRRQRPARELGRFYRYSDCPFFYIFLHTASFPPGGSGKTGGPRRAARAVRPRAKLARGLPFLMGRPRLVLVGNRRGLLELLDCLQDGAGFRFFVPGMNIGDTVLVWNIVQPGIVLNEFALIVEHIAAGGKMPVLVDTNIPPVCLVVDVINQVFRHLHGLKIQNIHTAKFFIVFYSGVKLEAVKVLGQVDQVLDGACVFPGIHDRLQLFQLVRGHFLQKVRQIIELVKAFVFPEVVIQPQYIALIVGNEVFLIPYAVYADPGEKGLHFLNSRGEFQIFPDLDPVLRVHSQIGHIGFKHHGGPAG